MARGIRDVGGVWQGIKIRCVGSKPGNNHPLSLDTNNQMAF